MCASGASGVGCCAHFMTDWVPECIMDENTPLIDREEEKCGSHGRWRLPQGTLRQKGMNVSVHYGLCVKEWPCRPKEPLNEG